MARVCDICGKGPQFGNTISHAHNVSKRRWNVNLRPVHAKVGAVTHPMLAEHYITIIDFYLDQSFLARVHLTPLRLNPAAALHLKAESGKLAVIEHCNLHGAWISETDL